MAKRQPTVNWVVKQLLRYPRSALVLVPGHKGMETNVKAVEEVPSHTPSNKDVADFDLQFVDGRRPGRKMVVIR